MSIIQQGFFGYTAKFCDRCGRALSNPISMQLHTGPICRAKGKISDMKTREFSDIALDEPLENGIVLKTIDGARATNVPHVVTHHSPDGFSWGYAGSGPADLALNLCEVILNRLGYKGERTACYDGDCFSTAYRIHQEFKFKFITPLPGDGATVQYQMVEDWIKTKAELMDDDQK